MTRIRALLATLVVAGSTFVTGAGVAHAQVTGPCTATIDGHDVSTATSPSSAIEVRDDATVEVRGTDSTGAPYTRIKLRFPPLPDFTVYDEPNDGSPTWGGTVKVSDYAKWGVGLYQVSGSTDDCTGTAWIKVTGRSPFTTVAGGVGSALVLGGLGGTVRATRRARPGFASLLKSMLSAAPMGIGAAVLAQQAAITPMTGVSLAAWTVGAGALSGVANLGVNALRGGASAAAAA